MVRSETLLKIDTVTDLNIFQANHKVNCIALTEAIGVLYCCQHVFVFFVTSTATTQKNLEK